MRKFIDHSPRFQRGFTLVEILVVVSILGLLASLIFASYTRTQKTARDSERRNDLKQYQTALENYASNNNSLYPITGGSTVDADSLCASNAALNTYMSGCLVDKRKARDVAFKYNYQSDTIGLKWALWAKLESAANNWVVCSDGRTGEKAQAGFSVSGGSCPL